MTMAHKVGLMGEARCRWCSGYGHSHKKCPTRARLQAKKIATGKFCREIHASVCLALRTQFGVESKYSDIPYANKKRLIKTFGKRHRSELSVTGMSN